MSKAPSPPANPQAQPTRLTAPEAAASIIHAAPDDGPTIGACDVIEADDLVEEISIDGMCGVY